MPLVWGMLWFVKSKLCLNRCVDCCLSTGSSMRLDQGREIFEPLWSRSFSATSLHLLNCMYTMVQIQSLLNPTMDDNDYDSKDEVSTHDSQTSTGSDKRGRGHDQPIRKKQKVVKDAAVFKLGTIREPCRYPPHEDQDDTLAVHHQMHEVYPLGSIADYPRHIPYNGGKKMFWEKTGRESFEGTTLRNP